jgi:hypothetical protein
MTDVFLKEEIGTQTWVKTAISKPRKEASKETNPANPMILTSTLLNCEKVIVYC